MFKKIKLKINWRGVFRITLWSLLIAAFIVSMGFTQQRRSELICKNLVIHIDDSLSQSFVEENDVRQIVINKCGNVIGKALSGINISVLESLIDNNPFVLKAEVFSTVDGELVIDVKQRNPVVRIINAIGEKYYIDEQGIFMPMNDKYSAQVPIANGNIFNKESEQRIRIETVRSQRDTEIQLSEIEKIFLVSDFVRKNDFWNAQVEQIFINAEGEIELTTRVGTQPVLFGNINDIEEKFEKLFLFYKDGLSKSGWNEYKAIDLRYKDQIVCAKN
jgi:cell division protein FtsQ